ncbi:MAG: DUF2796 domain-containing protein [Nitrosospira sp.]|nr:DUF2796 domain-containing protein [Nitrosospira sp.]
MNKKMGRAWYFQGQAVAAMAAAYGLGSPVWAHGLGAHIHGVAHLEIAIDDATVQINLITPLDNLVGFEHAPRNEKQRQAVKTMAFKFHRTDSLFIFTPGAQCRLESTELESPVLPPDLLIPSAEVAGSADKVVGGGVAGNTRGMNGGTLQAAPSDAHGELEATWQFHCAQPQALQGVDVKLFQIFPGVKRLDAAVAGPKTQASARLSPESSRLKW